MTQVEHIERGIRITCSCKSHAKGADSAVITGPTAEALAARKGRAQSDRIHGFILMANHPAAMLRKAAERDGVYAS